MKLAHVSVLRDVVVCGMFESLWHASRDGSVLVEEMDNCMVHNLHYLRLVLQG